MKAIRRSLKGGEKDHKSQHVSLTPKSAIAILPPKKVIKALYDYRPAPEKREELAFSKGDFFHVISREDDQHWYEACNPLFPNARGLVPVAFFEVIGKNQRDSGESVHAPPPDTTAAHAYTAFSDTSTLQQQQQQQQHHRQLSYQQSYQSYQPDVTATNTTKQGAQFRMSSLGKGAGAMVYGVVMYDFNAERPDELDAKAGEAIIVIAQSNPEWFVAKPIGRLGGPGLIPVSFIEIRDMSTGKSAADPLEAVRRAGVPRVEEWKKMTAEYKNSSISLGKFEGGVQQTASDLERMSLNSRPEHNHQRTPSKAQQGHYQVPIPVHASIPRYCFDNDKYWYVVEVQMEDGRWWELSRYYHDFYDFQIALLSKFEDEAGNTGGQRTLPFMPGPVSQVTNAISNGRRQSLDEYVKQLLAMPPHISRCQLVRQLFAPRPGDFEIDPAVMADDYRLSSGSQQSSDHNNPSRTASRQSSQGQMNAAGVYHQSQSQRPTHQRSQGSVSQTHTYPVQPPQQQQQQQQTLLQHPQLPPQPPSMSRQGSSFNSQMPSQGAIKIKVFFQDDIIVIRVPDDINLQQLIDKLRDRLKVDDGMIVRYKDEPSNSFVELLSDVDLETAIRRNAKLMLYVSIA